MTKELILKYLNNRCTKEELNEVLQWFSSNPENGDDKKRIFEIWENYGSEKAIIDDKRLSHLYDKIQQKIDVDTVKLEEHMKSSLSVVATWMIRVAAVLLIPVLAFLFYTLSERNSDVKIVASMSIDSIEVIAPIGSRTIVQLSDGSKVHLNYGSTLKYPQIFYGETREVILIGEAYFDVAHNPDKPFIVKAGKLNIKAVGTEFNVQSYSGEDAVSTTLVEGKVLLEKQLPYFKTEILGSMKPGQHVEYSSKTGKIISSVGNVEKYIAWKDGKLIFDDTSIEQITEKLSRMFNVDIDVDDNIKDYYYTVTFMDEPLSQILDLMTIATPVNYKILPRKKLPDGTFTKQKVIIESKK